MANLNTFSECAGEAERTVAQLFEDERRRQREVEGYTHAHDDTHVDGELLAAGMCYLREARGDNFYSEDGKPLGWPWGDEWWKPSTPERNFIKAGALFLAERERLKRASKYCGPVNHNLFVVATIFDEYRAGRKMGNCTQMRRKLVTYSTLNVATGETKAGHSEWVTEPCGAPLFDARSKTKALCPSCEGGWTHPNNYPVTDDGAAEGAK